MRKIMEKEGFKLYKNSEWNEFVVKHPTNNNAHYHTDDKQDAIDTMDAMIKEHQTNQKEYLVIVCDGAGSFGYAHGEDLSKTAKKARAEVGLNKKDVWNSFAYHYPKDYQYTINHFPMTVFFQQDGLMPDVIKANVRKLALKIGEKTFEKGE